VTSSSNLALVAPLGQRPHFAFGIGADGSPQPRQGIYAPRMRDLDTIDSELRLLARPHHHLVPPLNARMAALRSAKTRRTMTLATGMAALRRPPVVPSGPSVVGQFGSASACDPSR
jgi:hypothetical protein